MCWVYAAVLFDKVWFLGETLDNIFYNIPGTQKLKWLLLR